MWIPIFWQLQVQDIMIFECFINSTDSNHRVSGNLQKNDNILNENDRDTNTNLDPQEMEDGNYIKCCLKYLGYY